MYVKELLPRIKATSREDRFSLNLLKWVKARKDRNLIVAIATEGQRAYDATKTQTAYLYIGYSFEDGFFMGSRLGEILCNGARTGTWAFQPSMKFVLVPDWWQGYIAGGKCFIDPEHYLYGGKERWQLSEDGMYRHCIWCDGYEEYKHTEMVPQESWRRQIQGDFDHAR